MKILVEIDHKEFTYDSDGHVVRVGDTVIVPTPKWKRDMGYDDTMEGVVTALRSNYTGTLTSIIAVKGNPLLTDKELVDLIASATVVIIDGKRYARKSGWTCS